MSAIIRAVAAADALRDELVADLCELVSIPSIGGSPGEPRAQDWVSDRLEFLGLGVSRWRTPMPELRARQGFPGAEVHRDAVVGVLARLAGRSPDTTLLLGHTDVVPAADWPEAFRPQVRDDTVVGRGSADMKGGVAAMIHVARVLRRARVVPARNVQFATVCGEEDGGAGAFDLIPHLDGTAVECLIPEPTGGHIVVANAGALSFRIVIHGRSAHAAARWGGADAMAAAAGVQQALRGLESDLSVGADPLLAAYPIPHPTSVGTIAGGDWASTVMASVTMTGRYGIPIGADVDVMRRRFEAVVHEAVAAAEPGARAEVMWEGGQFASARQDPDHPAVQRLARSSVEVTGSQPHVMGLPYGSDMRQLLAVGLPTVLYGPGEAERAHAREESVEIPDVLRTVHVILRWILAAESAQLAVGDGLPGAELPGGGVAGCSSDAGIT